MIKGDRIKLVGMELNQVVCGQQFVKHRKQARRLFTVQKRF